MFGNFWLPMVNLKAVPVVTTRTLAPWTLGLLAGSRVAMSMVYVVLLGSPFCGSTGSAERQLL